MKEDVRNDFCAEGKSQTLHRLLLVRVFFPADAVYGIFVMVECALDVDEDGIVRDIIRRVWCRRREFFQLKPARIPRPQRLNVGRGGIAARRTLHL